MARDIPTFADVLTARKAVQQHLNRTPLLTYPGLSRLLGAEVHLKHENHHATGVFKVRGGVNLASKLTDDEKRAGLYTASTGNHGQSIAYAGQVTATRVTVAVPEGANPTKVNAMKALGASVLFHGANFDEARFWIKDKAATDGARYIGPTDIELIEGVATGTLEILEDLPDVDAIFVPIGGGSGASGACLVAGTLNPNVDVYGVQAEKAPAIYRSWRSGNLEEGPMETAAEGLATRFAFENTLTMLRDRRYGLKDFLLVSESAMEESVLHLLELAHTTAEQSGAAPLAGALSIRESLAGKKIAVIVSGGNIATGVLADIISRHRPTPAASVHG